MTKRPETLTVSLSRADHAAQREALNDLAEALGLRGISGLVRWLADTYTGAAAETEALLSAAGGVAEEWLAVSDPPAKNGPHLRWNGKSLLIRHHRPGLMKLIVIYPPAPDGDAATE